MNRSLYSKPVHPVEEYEADLATFSTAIKTAPIRPATQPSNKAYAIAMIFGAALGMTIATVAWAEMTEIAASQVMMNQ